MINSSLKEKYWDSATDKQMVISVVGTNQKIDNSMLEIGTFALEESLCSESELKFGACEANCVKFTARNTAGSIIGKTISIEETIDGDSENPMPYGVFKVASDVPTADRTKRQITAYDAMYDIINTDVKAWYAGLSFPMTLRQFRNSFFAHLGIAQVETNLVNDSMTVNKTIVATQTDDSSAVTEESAISGKTVVTAICEINGCFGNINREGKFEYVFLKAITSALYPAEDLFPSDNLFPSDANTESMTGHYITFDYEDFKSKAITQLEIKTSEDNAGAIVGTSGNNYSITGNFLVSDKTGTELEQIANNLLPIMAEAEYTPIKSCTCVGNPCLELGEPIRFNTTREIVETYLLQRTLTGVQSKRDSISAQGTQTHSAKVNSIRDTIESVERRTGKLERNADHLLSTYEDLEKQTNSKFEQTASSFEMSVTGGDKTVGIVIKLLNSDGDVISESSENANITITGVVRFEDLANAGQTTINGANITTGIISADRIDTENLVAKSGNFTKSFNVEIPISGSKNFVIRAQSDELCFIGREVYDSGLGGNVLYGIYFKKNRAYYAGNSGYGEIATKNDIPDMSDYLKKNASGKFNADYASSAGGLSGQPSVNLNDCKASDFYFIGSPSAGSSLLPIGYNSSTYHFGHYTGSSERFKNSISDKITEQALDPHRLYDADIFQYKYNADYLSNMADCRYDKLVIGFIAENLEKVYPVAVDKDDYGTIMDWNYKYVIPPMLSLIQEQHKEIEQLKSDNFALKGEVDILKQRLGKMEEMLNVINSKIN